VAPKGALGARKLAFPVELLKIIWESSSPTITLLSVHHRALHFKPLPFNQYDFFSDNSSLQVITLLSPCAHQWMRSLGLSQTWPEVVSCRLSSLSFFRFVLMTVSKSTLCADGPLQLTNVGIAVSCAAPLTFRSNGRFPAAWNLVRPFRRHLLILFCSLHQ
jgi:hypothetical protein